MKKLHTALLIIFLLGIFTFVWISRNKNTSNPPEQTSSIAGCYVATIGKDVYTLTILSQKGEIFDGKLSFKNFQKDSSSGTYRGTYKNSILLGDYSFQSEGMNSVIQVVFKKSGDNFIRGHGTLNADGTRFTDLNNITYDSSPLSVFTKGECAETTTYKNSELGIQFNYPTGPNGYILEEIAPLNAKNDLEKVITLFRAEDKKQVVPEGGEWPPVISISIFTNLAKGEPLTWASKNSEYSNINLRMSETKEIFVAGNKGIQYQADGLYASENVVVLRDDNAYVITGQYTDINSDIRRDFESVLDSIRFID